MTEAFDTAYEQLIDQGYCVVDGGLPAGKLDALRSWSDNWLANTKYSAKWRYQGSDIHLQGIRNPARRNGDMPQDDMIDFLIEHKIYTRLLIVGDVQQVVMDLEPAP